jgi:hypothetical protein
MRQCQYTIPKQLWLKLDLSSFVSPIGLVMALDYHN